MDWTTLCSKETQGFNILMNLTVTEMGISCAAASHTRSSEFVLSGVNACEVTREQPFPSATVVLR